MLFYWTTSNLWTMGQQFYVIRNNPAPGTPAFAAKQKRDEAKAARHGDVAPETEGDSGTTMTAPERPAQRQQPKRQSREQRKKQAKGGGQPKGGSQQPPEEPDEDLPPTHEKQ